MKTLKPKFCGEENIARSIKPTHEFHNGTSVPFGKYEEDGNFGLYYDTTSRYGYKMKAIYGVYLDRYQYKIFIGECPHKDENGEWVTEQKVPSFIVNSFAGAHFIDKEPDFPHIIRIITDEFDYEKHEDSNKTYTELTALKLKVEYCTLGTYLKGLKNRLHLRLDNFKDVDGEYGKQFTISNHKKNVYFNFYRSKDKKERYIWIDTDKWLYYTYFKKDGKRCLKFEKKENSHIYCGL